MPLASRPSNRVARSVDVAIVGFGPTGATLAGLLGQRGWRVAAFDRLPDIFPKPRAIAFDHEAMRTFQTLGFAEALLAQTVPHWRSEYRGADGQPILQLDMKPPPHILGWPSNLLFDQPAFERLLRKAVAGIDTVTAKLSCTVGSVEQDDEGVTLSVQGAAGGTERWAARYVVACDGASSPVRQSLSIPLESMDFDERWIVVDLLVNDAALAKLPRCTVQYCDPRRPATFVAGPGRLKRWELMTLPGEAFEGDLSEDQLWPLLSRWLGRDDARIWRSAVYRFHALTATSWRRGRIFLAGDAAHQTPPFMAQGLCQGIRDATNLAWKLDRVLAAGSSPALLDSYAQERIPHVTETTRLARELGQLICERDSAKARERDRRLLAEQGGTVRPRFRADLIPGLTGGLIASSTPMAGQPFPQPEVAVEGQPRIRLDELSGPQFRLVWTGRLDPSGLAPLIQTMQALPRQAKGARVIGIGSDVVERTTRDRPPSTPTGVFPFALLISEPCPLLSDWFTVAAAAAHADAAGFAAALVRPDHYVYGTAFSSAAACQLILAASCQVATG